ncbi:2-polyprenyl-6-methoxyphenol hydroxylase-like FAD-dependent oxidoreductase [Catenulispora sp. EB89]|uniref:NAD(P)/FAD-dependent oxidoreductase n=1 Tax=Catenulispora sp. EB89 TaxID=3156257 RepID=UPI00351439FA
MYDAVVVGARCAGAATALLLARAGRRVLVVDRAAFPRDTMSTLYIQRRGVGYLDRWGLLDQVAAVCPALDRISYQIGDVRLEGFPRPVDGMRAAYAPRRYSLDAILVEAAVAAGAEFRESCCVEDLLYAGDRITGVRLRSGGALLDEPARLVVGADGMRSTVAARVGATDLVRDPPQTCVYYSFWAGAADHFELYEAPGRWVGAVPTNDGLTLVQAYFRQDEFSRVRADAPAAYLENVRTTAPELYERMLAGGQAGRLYGTGDQRNFFRTAAGPGWALAGDASHHRDSITARGITHAFLQADLLAGLVAPVLDDPARLDAALARYARERYDALLGDYHRTLSTARLAVPWHRVGMLREVAADPVRVEEFFSAMAGAPRSGAGSLTGAGTGTGTDADAAQSVRQAIAWMRDARRVRV